MGDSVILERSWLDPEVIAKGRCIRISVALHTVYWSEGSTEGEKIIKEAYAVYDALERALTRCWASLCKYILISFKYPGPVHVKFQASNGEYIRIIPYKES